MPSGLLIDLNDGRPMQIVAGMRCPSYSGSTNEVIAYDTVNINKTPGSQVFVIPLTPVVVSWVGGTYFPYWWAMSGFVDIGDGTLRFLSETTDRRTVTYRSYIFEMLPAAPAGNNTGLLIENSTDFASISSNANVMTCVYSGDINVNGSVTPPAQGLIFATWNAANVAVYYDGGQIHAYYPMDNSANNPANINLRIAIFQQSPPVPGTGLNFFNASGQCTFSTSRKPFIISGNWNVSDGYTDIGNNMVALASTGVQTTIGGGYCNVRVKGIERIGNSVRALNSTFHSNWTDKYPLYKNTTTAIPLPLIPNFY